MAVLTGIARKRPWRGLQAVLVLLAAACLPRPIPAAESARPSSEYQVKAVFLFNFAQFAEWPAPAFASPAAPLVIGILGHDPFGAYLDDLVRDEKIGDHPILVRRYAKPSDVNGCHILFISRSEVRQIPGVLRRFRRQPVLTISDTDNFTRRGGMVRFAMEAGKVRLRINVEVAKAAGLTISSKILRPATIVSSDRD